MPSLRILTLAVIVLYTSLSSAIPVDNSGNAYSGMGGNSKGGNVTTTQNKSGLLGAMGLGSTLLNIGSFKGGNGGKANSGDAIGGFLLGSMLGPKFGRWAGGGGSNSGNAYTQDGGVANGGSVEGPDGLINIDSYTGGSGGDASSGTAVGGVGGGGSRQDDWEGHDNSHEDRHDDDKRDGGHHEHDGDDDDCDC